MVKYKILKLLEHEGLKDMYNDPSLRINWDSDAKKFVLNLSIAFGADQKNRGISIEKEALYSSLTDYFPEWDEDRHEYPDVIKSKIPVYFKQYEFDYCSVKAIFTVYASTLDECLKFFNKFFN